MSKLENHFWKRKFFKIDDIHIENVKQICEKNSSAA